MSIEVENRVVEMQFNNARFERNAATTISTLEKLKQRLDFTGVSRGLTDVGDAASSIDMSNVGNSVSVLSSRLSAMNIIGVTALANIANAAVNAGKRMLSALTIDPIKTGFSEYETQINSIQTILANTDSKGTTLENVTNALDTLNEYADKTIYNFTEMTRNIGTFTAAGIDLDTSVKSIQGIANLAAVSGSTSQQASTAMYQLSQALSSGTVKLMDWNSVVNAGMGGQVFQDALKETARVHGVAIDDMIEKEGSFRNTLQNNWLTADILTETLEKFTMTTEGASEAEIQANRQKLKSIGYTDAQIEGIFKLGNTATNAATKVKTFTQLWDTLKESAQSGWTQTWEIIVGDFEEAKALLTKISEVIGGILNESSKARNDLLQGWKDSGGRADLITAFANAFDSLMSVVGAVKEAFADIFPPLTVKQLVDFTNGLKQLTENMKPSAETLENVKNTFKGLFVVVDIVADVLGSVLPPVLGIIGKLGIGLLKLTGSLGKWLVSMRDGTKLLEFFVTLGDTMQRVLHKISNFMQPVVDGIKIFGGAISSAFDGIFDKAEGRLGPIASIGNAIKKIFAGIGSAIKAVAPFISNTATEIGNVFGNLTETITSSIQNANFESVFDAVGGIITGLIGIFVAKFFKSGSSMFDGVSNVFKDAKGIVDGILKDTKGIVNNINSVLGGASKALGAFTDSIKSNTLKQIAIAIGILAASLLVISLIDSEKLGSSLAAVMVLIGELMGGMSLFMKAIDGSSVVRVTMLSKTLTTLAGAILILSFALKIMSTMSWSEMGVGLISLTVGLGALIGAVKLLSMIQPKKLDSSVSAIKKLAGALIVLAFAIKIMGSMSWTEMGVGLISMVVGLGALVAAVYLLPDTKVNGAAKAITKLSGAILVLAIAIRIMGSMSWTEMGVGLISMVVGLGALVAAVNLLPKDTALRALGMVGLATAMVVLGAALKLMSSMSWDEIARGLTALGGSLAILVIALQFMKTAIPGALAILIIAPALRTLADVLNTLSAMSWLDIARGLVALGGALAIIAVAMNFMTTAIAGAAALVVIAIALATLTPVLTTLGSMSWGEVIKGLVALAAAFAIIGVAGYLLGPLVPAILALSKAIMLLGVGCALAGIGILAIGAGLTAISTAGAAVAMSLVTIIAGIISLIPYLIEQIGIGIINLCKVIAGSADAICDALTVVITALFDAIVASVPAIVEGLMKLLVGLSEAMVAYGPQLGDLFNTLLVQLFDGLVKSVPMILESMISLFIALLDALATSIPRLIDPLCNFLEALFQGIAAAVGPIIKTIIAPVLDILADLVLGLVEALAPYIPSIENMIEIICGAFVYLIENVVPIVRTITDLVRQLGDSITQILQGIATVIVSIGNTIYLALQGIADVFDSVFNGIVAVVTSVGDSIRTVLDGIAGTIDSVAGVIETALGGLSDIFDSVFNGIATVVTSVGESIKSVLDGIAGVIDSIGTAALNAGTGFDKLANGIRTITSLSLTDMAASLAAVAVGIADIAVHAGGIKDIGNGMAQLSSAVRSTATGFGTVSTSAAAMSETLLSVKSVVMELPKVFAAAATSMIANMISALGDGTKKIPSAAVSMVRSAVTAINGTYSSFRSAGAYVTDGFAAGIDDRTWYAEAKAKAMAKAALEAAEEALDENSPSKEFYKVGAFAGKGFVNAFVDYESVAFGAGSDMAKAATRGLNKTVSRLSKIIDGDIDVQPVIRPVLDLSAVRSGANAIGGMLGLRPSVGVLATAGSISASMNARGQNGSNDDVVSAINKLGKSLGNMGNTYNIVEGVTYDDGSEIANAVGVLARAIIQERRV